MRERLRRGLARARVAVVRSRHGVVVASLALVILGLAAGPASLAAPASCNWCHAGSGVYDQWRGSAHADARCQQCHVDRGYLAGLGNSAALASEVWRSVFGGPGDTAWVPDEACLGCHPTIGGEETFTVAGLRMSHIGLAEGGFQCMECHRDAAHEPPADRIPEPTMSTCARCHNNVAVSGACEVCHAGKRAPDEARRVDAEWSKTHGENWRALHGMGELSTCTVCHEPKKCEGCHGMPLPHDSGFAATHGGLAVLSKEPCYTCHTTAFCHSCHGMEMPHPDGFLPEHSAIAESYDDPLCKRCHTVANCHECHIRHTHPGLSPRVLDLSDSKE